MLSKFIQPIENFFRSEKSAPWVLLITCILGYGLFVPILGYFQDDWSVVFNHYLYGNTGIIELMAYDGRPFSPWLYLIGFELIGYNPTAWQIGALIMRWLTAVIFWQIFKLVWPNAKWQNLTAALIFALYPFFTLQPLAATFILHWTGYLLYGLSIYFMLQAVKKKSLVYTFIAITCQVLHLFTLEFFTGIELLRPIFLWLILPDNNLDAKEKIKKSLKQWIPYLIVFLIFFIWRGFLYQAPDAGRNAPVGLANLLDNPISTFFTIALTAIPDLVLILVSSWYETLKPEIVNFNSSINRYSLMIGVAALLGYFYYLSKQNLTKNNQDSPSRQILLVGGAALILGLAPVYVAGYEIHSKIAPWNSRFSLGSLFGAALFITGLIDVIVKTPKTRWIIIASLLGLLISFHLHNANNFRWSWEKQVNFYRQLYLRAPALEPDTALLSEEEFQAYMGNYSTSYAINLIYADENSVAENSRQADYWLFTYAEFHTKLDDYLNGQSFSIGTNDITPRAGISFQGEPNGSVVISFTPELGQCLWVIRPEYASSKALSQVNRQLASISFINRIKQAPQNPDSFLFEYLYTHPKRDWCHYYEQADLAYQYEEWDQVLQLWKTATEAGLQPDNGFEYLPFIEAFAHKSDWETAKRMTRISQKTMQGIDPLLCHIWTNLENDTPESPEKEAAIISVREDLRCDQE